MEDLLERAGEARFAKRGLPMPIRDWRSAVGPRIAARARPVAIERGALIVRVATSVWANELSLLAPELLKRLNEYGLAVDALRFRVGALDLEDRPPERRRFRRVPAPAALGADLQASIAGISDDDLRAAIEQAARANLAWQSFVSEEPPDARVPRDAGRETVPRDRSGAGFPGASPRSSGGGGDRRR